MSGIVEMVGEEEKWSRTESIPALYSTEDASEIWGSASEIDLGPYRASPESRHIDKSRCVTAVLGPNWSHARTSPIWWPPCLSVAQLITTSQCALERMVERWRVGLGKKEWCDVRGGSSGTFHFNFHFPLALVLGPPHPTTLYTLDISHYVFLY
jgi:hypothetical protein